MTDDPMGRLERMAWLFAAMMLAGMVGRGAASIIHDGWWPGWLWNPWH